MSLKAHAMLIIVAAIFSTHAETYTWTASRSTGKDACWEDRDGYMGIKGTGKPLSGNIWWTFTGPTGSYKIEWSVGLESDGAAEYKITAGGTSIKSGNLPYPPGGKQCEGGYKILASKIDCGTHNIAKGAKINVWAKSVYPCGDHGAYCRWKSMSFIGNGTTGLKQTKSESRPILSKSLHPESAVYDLQGRPLARGWAAHKSKPGAFIGAIVTNQGASLFLSQD